MSNVIVNTEGIDRLISEVKSLESIDFTPLMKEWSVLLEKDNEENALAGIDGFGIPLIEVTYRPVKESPNYRVRKQGSVVSEDMYRILPYNNLTSSHYRTLDGPPLAPRGVHSRIIQNFRRDYGLKDGMWF